jgi:hypothetical protein
MPRASRLSVYYTEKNQNLKSASWGGAAYSQTLPNLNLRQALGLFIGHLREALELQRPNHRHRS